jgi:hypothetical protein
MIVGTAKDLFAPVKPGGKHLEMLNCMVLRLLSAGTGRRGPPYPTAYGL